MERDSSDRLDHLFRAARLYPPDERLEFVEAVCIGAPSLKSELLDLLAAADEADSEGFMQEAAADLGARLTVEFDDLTGQTVGPFAIMKRIGRGGMGDVYLAHREAPFRQRVAIKVVRRGMDYREATSRFEVERQILASLAHPNIAGILDGGFTDDGRPYIVMEYVEGLPIDRYCDEQRLSVDDRLALFQKVCRAVHAAHQNLVLHRDLKPANILVSPAGDVKLLDFGIAKLLNPTLGVMDSPLTRTELRLMTPEYASPEQARGDSPLSTASDIYTLGVILYELLAGRRPYDVASGSTLEMLRLICEVDPERPSTRITRSEIAPAGTASKSSRSAADISVCRGSSIERLRRRLRGDLDTIVLKALRKDPHRRYASAEQFSEDIQRFLDGHPILARPATAGYKMRTFVRRHRTPVTASAVVLIFLVLFSAITTHQSSLLKVRSQQAEVEAATSLAVSDFLVSLFGSSNPYVVGDPDTLRVADYVRLNVSRVRNELADQPAVKARLLASLGEVNRRLSEFDAALELLEEAISIVVAHHGPVHETVAQLHQQIGLVYLDAGRYTDAETELRRALEVADGSVGPSAPLAAGIIMRIGVALQNQNRFREAETYYTRALEMHERYRGPESVEAAAMHRSLGGFHRIRGDSARARHHLDRSLRVYRTALGDEHTDVAISLAQLGLYHRSIDDHNSAREAFLAAIEIYRRLVGERHPWYSLTLNDLALTYRSLGDLAAADSTFAEVVSIQRQLFGERSPTVITTYANWALLMNDMEQFDRSEELARLARQELIRYRGPDHWHVAVAEYALGEALAGQARFPESEVHLLRSYGTLNRLFGDDHHLTRQSLQRLVRLYTLWNRPEEANPLAARLASDV
jgi:eukaryotic-like serine/threonine-protein kinase